MRTATRFFDVIVIGSGPAGEGASMKLAKCGKRVAVIENYADVGGGCTHWGTIPSKTLRQSVQMLKRFRSDPIFRKIAGPLDVTWPDLLKKARSVVDEQVTMRENFYYRNRVELIYGTASFIDSKTVAVSKANGHSEVCSAENIIIATGSTPYQPDDICFDHPRVCDSDSILNIDYVPRSVIIYGAGVIGCEYASIFGNLGVKVDLVNTHDRLLSFLDAEIAEALGYHFRENGVTVRNHEHYASVEASDHDIVMTLESGKRFHADVLLWANGRSGNTDALRVENAGLQVNKRKQIEIDSYYRSSVPNIFAVGDVAGPPGLASASYDQGRFAGAYIGEGRCENTLITDIPTGIYTDPEISSIGMTETQLTERKTPYEVGRALFGSIARAQITGQTTGMVKILFHAESLEILGIHCFGHQAAEIVHIGQAIMRQPPPNNRLTYFTDNTFNYPTMAEAYRVAALNGLNRVNRDRKRVSAEIAPDSPASDDADSSDGRRSTAIVIATADRADWSQYLKHIFFNYITVDLELLQCEVRKITIACDAFRHRTTDNFMTVPESKTFSDQIVR